MKNFTKLLFLSFTNLVFCATIQSQTVTTILTNTDGISFPTGLAFDANNNLYVADASANKIFKVTSTGTVTTLATVAAPLGLAYNSGFLYAANSNNGNIYKVDISNGSFTTLATSASYRGLAVDVTTGNLYGSDHNNGLINKVTPAGVKTTFISSVGIPYGVAVDGNSNVFVGEVQNNSVLKITSAAVKTTFNATAGGPSAIVADPTTGIVYLVYSNTIIKLSSDGTTKTTVATLPTGVSTYGIAIDGFGNLFVSDYSNKKVYKITGMLPLTLSAFTAQIQNNTVNLSWQTANEVNSAYFTIQRSVDGTNFSSIGKVVAKGDGSYSYVDNQLPNTEVIYYRLQMVDKDGSFTYSQVVSVNFNAKLQTLNLYPNPVKDNLFVQLTSTKSEKLTLQVTDLQGKILQQEDTQIGVGNVSLSVNTATLPKGSYVILVKGSTMLQQKQFVKE